MKKALISALLLSTTLAHAEDGIMTSAYSFGGACGSQGVWTQNALSATQGLRKITIQLRDDANCKALGVSTQAALEEIQGQLKNIEDGPKNSNRLSQIPGEIDALRTFAAGDPAMKTEVMRLMMDRSIEGAKISAQVGAENASAFTPNASAQLANQIGDFGQRVQRSTKVGIGILNRVVDSIPQLDQCLNEDGQQALGNFIASTVQVATAFAGSGQDSTGSQMAQLVSKLTTMIRDRKYAGVLRKLNQQEFLTSMSCLMEVTSESYCQARDAMGLFQDGMNNIEWRKAKGKQVEATNPFLGYYVLNTHIPNITKWMQKIQIGVDPKLPTDADFQNKIQQEVTDFYKGLKTLLGTYNSTLMTIKQLPSLEAKQNAVIELVRTITASMSGNRSGTNFFELNKTAMKIPFFLIGMDQIPDQVAGKANGLMPMDFDQWLQAHYNELPQFQDPVALAETVGRNMQALSRDANISVISYFSNWYVVDKQALVNEALTDVNYTVKDSLRVVRSYLDVVKNRVGNGGDASVISTLMDTQVRIDSILAAFDEAERIGKLFQQKADASQLTAADIQMAADGSEKLVNTVFDKFNVMQSRSGFLANRMVNFVYQDYIQLMKSNDNFSDNQKQIFIQAGMAALDRMLQMYNGNPANVQSDLNMALKINKGNIDALDMLIKDNVIANIANLKLTAENKNKKSSSTGWNSVGRFFSDFYESTVKVANKWELIPNILFAGPLTAGNFYMNHSNRYPMAGTGENSPQSEFKETSFILAQVCVQALAFNDQQTIKTLCDKQVLKSPYTGVTGYDMSYNARLKSHLKDEGIDDATRVSLNHSARICAFRDYNRKNMVLFMSINKQQ